MNHRGSIIVFVLILAALLAVSLLTLIRMVGLSFYSSDDYITESQAYLLARNCLIPDYSQYLFDHQWVLQNNIASADYENFELEGFRSGETFLCRLSAFDSNRLFPYVWYSIFDHLDYDSSLLDYLNDAVIYSYSSERPGTLLEYTDSFLYFPSDPEDSDDYEPEFFRARQKISKNLLTPELKPYIYLSLEYEDIHPVLSIDALNHNGLPFFVSPGSDDDSRHILMANTSGIEEKLEINTIDLPPGSIIYENIFYRLLRNRFPDAEDKELIQYLLNLHDSLGTTDKASVVSLDTGEILSNDFELRNIEPYMLMLGRSRTPVINEVWGHTPPPANNDGQYIEIYNPYEEEFDITGWSLVVYQVSNVNSPTPDYTYRNEYFISNRVLLPGEYLIITNDFDDTNDPDSDGYSFFDHLGKYLEPHEYEEILDMELPIYHGRIELWNNEEQLIDYFEYRFMLTENIVHGHQSCQRYYPLTWNTYYDYPTPAEQNISPVNIYPDINTLLADNLEFKRTRPPLNRLFYNLAEILLVPTSGYFGEFTIAGQTEEFFSPFVLMDKSDNTGLSVGILDLFYIDLVSDDKGNPLGKININTASEEVIELLTNNQAFASQVEMYRNMHQANYPAFLSFGEFFQAPIWEGPENTWLPFFTSEQVDWFSRFADFITFFSDDYWGQVDLKHFFKDQSGEEEVLPPGSEWDADFSFLFRIQRDAENF